jgi:hypothetical protein
MRSLLTCLLVAAVAAKDLRAEERSAQSGASPFVGAYLLIDSIGLAKLQTLASNAATLPFTRLFISFVSPSLVYAPGSNTLQYTRLGLSTQGPDYGFNALKTAVGQLQAGGLEVFISMGKLQDYTADKAEACMHACTASHRHPCHQSTCRRLER